MNRTLSRLLCGLLLLMLAAGCQPTTPAATKPPEATQTPAPTATNPPPPTPTPGISFEIRNFTSRVFLGTGAPLPELLDTGFHPFPEGSQTSTDSTGVALVEGTAASGVCHIFIFKASTLKKSACQPGTFAGGNTSCVEAGSALYNNCSGHIVITSSGVAEHRFTALSVTYLPEQQISLYLALDGAVVITPLRELGNYTQTAEPIELQAGQYLYTAPDNRLVDIQGIPMRVPQQADTIRPILEAFNLWDWMNQTQSAVDSEGVPAQVVPPAPTNELYITLAGGFMDQPGGKEAVLYAAPWQDYLVNVFGVEGVVLKAYGMGSEAPLDARNYPYSPNRTLSLMRESSYGQGFGAMFFVPEGNERLASLAKTVIPDLLKVGIEAELTIQPAGEIPELVKDSLASGIPVMWLFQP